MKDAGKIVPLDNREIESVAAGFFEDPDFWWWVPRPIDPKDGRPFDDI